MLLKKIFYTWIELKCEKIKKITNTYLGHHAQNNGITDINIFIADVSLCLFIANGVETQNMKHQPKRHQ